MAGMISFHFDDGYSSHYEQAFKVFEEAGVPGCIGLIARDFEKEEVIKSGDAKLGPLLMTKNQALEMQKAGWEIVGHSRHHKHMNQPLEADDAYSEIVESKKILEREGFLIKQFMTPMSVCHPDMIPLISKHYEGAFTEHSDSSVAPIEELVQNIPLSKYRLHRSCLTKHTPDQLKEYVDYVEKHDRWLVFYDHDLGVNGNITEQGLRELLEYCKQKGVEVLTSSDALLKAERKGTLNE